MRPSGFSIENLILLVLAFIAALLVPQQRAGRSRTTRFLDWIDGIVLMGTAVGILLMVYCRQVISKLRGGKK